MKRNTDNSKFFECFLLSRLLVLSILLPVSLPASAQYNDLQRRLIVNEIVEANEMIARGTKMANTANRYSPTANFGRGGYVDMSNFRAKGKELVIKGQAKLQIAQTKLDNLDEQNRSNSNRRNEALKWVSENSEFRQFTSTLGSTKIAAFFSADKINVVLINQEGEYLNVPRYQLIQEDNNYIDKINSVKVSWEPICSFEKNLFPSVILSDANWRQSTLAKMNCDYYGLVPYEKILYQGRKSELFLNNILVLGDVEKGFIGVEIDIDKQKVVRPFNVALSVKCNEGFINDTVDQFKIDFNAGDHVKSIVCYPKLSWDYEKLKSNLKNTLTTFTFEMDIGGISESKVIALNVRSINDVVWKATSVPFMGSQFSSVSTIYKYTFQRDFSNILSCYVNEASSLIDGVKRDILSRSNTRDRFSGTPNDFQDAIDVWRYLKEKGIQYSNQANTGIEESGVLKIDKTDIHLPLLSSQRIRTLQQVLDVTQANCLDGSILLSSLLINLGYDVSVVITPNHAFVCIDLIKDDVRYRLPLETTVLGSKGEITLDEGSIHNIRDRFLKLSLLFRMPVVKSYFTEKFPWIKEKELMLSQEIMNNIKPVLDLDDAEDNFWWAAMLGMNNYYENFSKYIDNDIKAFEFLSLPLSTRLNILKSGFLNGSRTGNGYVFTIMYLKRLNDYSEINPRFCRKLGFNAIDF